MHYSMSIIIPTKNRAFLLKDCIDALEIQVKKKRDVQVIIVDDHSNQKTLSNYNQLLSQIRNIDITLIYLPKGRKGAVHARNFGLEKAHSKIIGFLDDDAVPCHNWVHSIKEFFTSNLSITAVTGHIEAYDLLHPLSVFRQNFYNIRFNDIKSEMMSKSIAKDFGLYYQKNYHFTNNISGGNSAIRKHILDRLNGFDETFVSMHDKELTYRILKSGSTCVYLPNLKIRHHHTKSFKDALQKSFKSGRMTVLLMNKHPEVFAGKSSPINIRRPYQIIVKSNHIFGKSRTKKYSLIYYIFLLEYCHQLGFVVECGKQCIVSFFVRS
ncbi:MAG: glycosyltransferase [Candidatus Scalindua sp.]|jgi:glycosyltransferase involved in cell wall biosynthesis|nr:glycosyltransferase [Candidatus Scalindua sp.]